MRKNKVTAYDEVTGKGLVRHVLIRKGFTSGQLMVCLVINKKMTKMSYPIAGVQKNTNEFLPNQGELLAALAKIQGMTSVSVSINAEKTNVIMGTMIHNLWGESTIEDTIHVRDMQKENYPYTGDALTFRYIPLSLLSGESRTDREALQSGSGICGTDRKRDSVGYSTAASEPFPSSWRAKPKRCVAWRSSPRPSTMPERMRKRNHIENAEFFVGKAKEDSCRSSTKRQ